MEQTMKLIEGGHSVIFNDIVEVGSILDESLIQSTITKIANELAVVIPSVFTLKGTSLIVTSLNEDAIGFFCSLMVMDNGSFMLLIADSRLELRISKNAVNSELNTWLILLNISQQYRYLIASTFIGEISDITINKLIEF
jgi:hypothetical protein